MMMSQLFSRTLGPRKGFTLIELAASLVIIGVLASFGVPRFLDSVERSRAAEAFAYLSAVHAAQEQYKARHGTYAARLADVHIDLIPPHDFRLASSVAVGSTGSLDDSWTLTLTRDGETSSYGEYTVTFTEQGYDYVDSTIDALPAIVPTETSSGFSGD